MRPSRATPRGAAPRRAARRSLASYAPTAAPAPATVERPCFVACGGHSSLFRGVRIPKHDAISRISHLRGERLRDPVLLRRAAPPRRAVAVAAVAVLLVAVASAAVVAERRRRDGVGRERDVARVRLDPRRPRLQLDRDSSL